MGKDQSRIVMLCHQLWRGQKEQLENDGKAVPKAPEPLEVHLKRLRTS